eukprot:14971574-Alexandrium_andersonii.AAC.1
MSASLVGSEMCIRDRCAPAARPALPGGRQLPAGSGLGPKAGLGLGVFGCLLYTSDAADDM